MTIGIDGRLWSETGIGRYIRNLVFNLLELDKENEYILFVRPDDENQIKNQISKFKIKNLKLKIIPVNIPWHGVTEQLLFPKLIDRQNLDLMHFPYFSVPVFLKTPFIVTIHDLIYHHFTSGEASTLPLWAYGFKMLAYRFVINNATRKAKRIIAVSNVTRDEIFDHLIVNKDKVEVIYEAADDFSQRNGSTESKRLDIRDFFLYVGNVYPHKNVKKLIQAFSVFSKNNNTKLVFVGRDDFFYKNLKKQLGKMIADGKVIVLENTNDQELLFLYKNAICLLRPSLMEGFSLPPLEAMSSGCLVLASDIPVHREILGDAPIYFDPGSIEDIIDKMGIVYSFDEKKKGILIEKGTEKARNYSWKKTAAQTLRLYESSASAGSA